LFENERENLFQSISHRLLEFFLHSTEWPGISSSSKYSASKTRRPSVSRNVASNSWRTRNAISKSLSSTGGRPVLFRRYQNANSFACILIASMRGGTCSPSPHRTLAAH
jgi:hypothetical protein